MRIIVVFTIGLNKTKKYEYRKKKKEKIEFNVFYGNVHILTINIFVIGALYLGL